MMIMKNVLLVCGCDIIVGSAGARQRGDNL